MPHQTPATLVVNLSDAVIRRHMSDPAIRQLRDPRYPLRVRFNQARTRASWFVVRFAGGADHWRKIGAWPDLASRAVIAQLPDIQARLAVDPTSPVGATNWQTVGDLLVWFRNRSEKNRQLSASRKSQFRVAINRHLLPGLGVFVLDDLAPSDLDDHLVWPMQARYAVSTIRQVLSVLKVAFKQASKVGQIASNPVSDVRLSDFLDARAKPKPGRLRADHLPEILPAIGAGRVEVCVLLLLVLLFGTRISETRLAKWRHVDLSTDRRWTIPAEHVKSRREHRLPLTDVALTLLKRYREWQLSRGYRGVYLFPGSQGKPIGKSAAHEWVNDIAAGEWTSHDLRKLARTAWADLGVDYLVSELLLNHALSDLDRTYIHTYVERQAEDALSRYHQWLFERGISTILTETIPRQTAGADSHAAQWWRGAV
ncbi:tyrosine-type recombinase/integrase [Salinicola corii]|uniref:Tyrosine-type recombinase/integrase n=2 Tax=Salinicola corii TaxID=2606937 RepID=A0A640W7G9_9GAMM|nr:tyrosine-type recombinase/integrase [Salinicola corii]